MDKIEHPCPVCGKTTFSEEGGYEICRVCNWEDDPVQEKDPNYAGGANVLSLNQAKEEYERKALKGILE